MRTAQDFTNLIDEIALSVELGEVRPMIMVLTLATAKGLSVLPEERAIEALIWMMDEQDVRRKATKGLIADLESVGGKELIQQMIDEFKLEARNAQKSK